MKYIYLIALILLLGTTARAQSISKAQAIADIDYFNQALQDVHYNPYLYVSQTTYTRLTDSLKNSLKDSISIKAFTLLLDQLTASIDDGHTSPSIAQQALKADFTKEIYFPLELVADETSKVYLPVQANQYGIPAGAEVVEINGINIPGFYERSTKFVGGLPAFRKAFAVKLLSNYLYLSGLMPPFKVNYKIAGKLNTVVIDKGITLKACLAKALPQVNKENYAFRLIDHKVAYIELITMQNDLNKYSRFFDSCFVAAEKNHISTVAIDLRRNLGGNSTIADLLISYFNTQPYRLAGGRLWRISQRYKDYLRAAGDTAASYLKEPVGTVRDRRSCNPDAPMFINNTHLFKGKVYLITGPMTFSSAVMLADGIKQYHMATIVGEPTGENTTDFGEVYPLQLTNSKINLQVSTSFDLGADCQPEHPHPVMPDKLIRPTLSDKISGKDPVLAYILKQVKAG